MTQPTYRLIGAAALLVGLAALGAPAATVAAGAGTTEPSGGTSPDTTAPMTDVAETTGPAATAPPDAPQATIGLSILAPAPALELAASGIRDATDACTTAHIEIIERNAEGDIPSLTAIAEGFIGDDVDLIATVTTPAAQAAFQVVSAAGGTTPVVFAVVTDPFAAGLAEDPETHEPWITGSQSLPPFAEVIDATQQVLPDVEVLGVVYNPSESNAQTNVDALQAIADERDLVLELATVADSSEVAQASEALVGRGIDVFILPTDTTVVSGVAAMAQIADDNDIPIIGTDSNHAIDGAAIGLGTDYYGSGVRAGEIACAVVSGEATPADFDVIPVESLAIAVNPAAAEAQGVTIPDELLEQAEVVD